MKHLSRTISLLMMITGLVACNDSVPINFLTARPQGHFTPEQLNYLKSDNYADTTPYNGNMSVSKPLPVSITWKNGKGQQFVTLTNNYDDNEVTYEVRNNSLDFYNPILGATYTATVRYREYSSTVTFEEKTEVNGPRNIYVDGVENFRDIGGWGKIKQGLLYRSGRFNEDLVDPVKITISDEGLREINNHLKIKTEIDLRRTSNNEVGSLTDKSVLGDNVKYFQLPMVFGGQNILTFKGRYSSDTYEYDNPAMIKRFFEILADKDNYPINYHCSIGKDRTGCLSYLVEGLLGFDQETMYRDYMFTNFADAGMCKLTDITDRYGKTIDEYTTGTTLAEKIYNYLNLEIGVSKDNLDQVINILKAQMEEIKDNVIELKPLSKWKRFLVFFGDYFITFIISFILFNLAVFPLAKIICDTQNRSEKADQLEQKALNMLRVDHYLFSPTEFSSFEDSVNYTFKVFLSYYAFDEETPDQNNKQYGHKEENEVIRAYYQNVIKDTSSYINDFKEVNKADDMFVIGEDVLSIALKSDYKKSLANELLEVTDESKYSTMMTNFRDHVFAKLYYLHVYNHIIQNDYVKNNESFNGYLNQAKDIMKSLQWVATASSLISITLAWGITFILYPLINKENRTITMSAMRVTKLHYKSLGPIDKKTVLIQSFYHFVFAMSGSLFMPILFFGLAYSFNLPLLFILFAISIGLAIVSGIFIFVNEHNRSGSDILTNVVLVPTSELNNMYREQLENGQE